MAVSTFEDLMVHVGHKLECVTYCNPPQEVCIECITCGEVLIYFDIEDKEDWSENPKRV